MSNNPTTTPYYGCPNDELMSVGVSFADQRFILKSFKAQHLFESWASWHDGDEELNQHQANQLVDNMRSKQQELMDELLTTIHRKLPPFTVRQKHMTVRRDKDTSIVWMYWDSHPLSCMTEPIHYVRNSRLWLRWYFAPTEWALGRIAKRSKGGEA